MNAPKKFIPLHQRREEILKRIRNAAMTFKEQIELERKVFKATTYQELEKIEKELNR